MTQMCAEPDFKASTLPSARLLEENARLRRLCAQSKEVVARYELLLREGDHRIKNSLQIVATLMGLQERRETNAIARDALRTASARIQAVARIHDALQLAGGKDVVDLTSLLEIMCGSLQSMARDPNAVRISIEAERIETPIALAQPIVLAVNELIVNALRHAFEGREGGAITLHMAEADGALRVVVADDGVGLPDNYTQGGGYGMTLVRMMIAKLGGVLEVENDSGARFTLSAPMRAQYA